jgi:hypothetical protein
MNNDQRPQGTGYFEEPTENALPLMVALGQLVLAAAVLEKTLHLELVRLHYERAHASGDPEKYGLEQALVATERLTSGQARAELEALGLPEALNARIRSAVKRRNALLHRPLEDLEFARAIGTGEDIDKVVSRIERLAIDCGELGVEIERYAGDRLTGVIGMHRGQIAELVTEIDVNTVNDQHLRAQLEAIKSSGIDFSRHPYPFDGPDK